MKILQFVPEALPTFRADVAVLFGKYLPRYQVECEVVGMASPAASEQQGFSAVRRPRYAAGRLAREVRYLGLCLRTLLGARRDRYAAIQVRDMVPVGLLALLIARCKGIPFYYWMSYPMSEGRIERARAHLRHRWDWRNALVLLKGRCEHALLYRVVLPAADHVFVQSDAMLAALSERGVAAPRMTAVPMGVDLELLAGRQIAPLRPAGWERVPVLAYLGTLDRARQLERVVDALHVLRESVPTACLLFIGNSPQAADEVALLAHARARGLGEAVRITGWLPSQQAWRLLAGASAAISYIPRGPLYDVSSPTKLLEYLALGVPAVGNDIPDQAQVLEHSGAGWLTASEPAAMAAALRAILADPAAARATAARGYAYIDAHRSYRVLAEALARRYQALAR